MHGEQPQANRASNATGVTAANRHALVLGGAGVAGETVVHALLRRGVSVVVPSRDETRLAHLRDHLPDIPAPAPGHDRARLHTIVGDIGTPDGVAAVADTIVNRVGAPDAVVASLGGWWEGEHLVDLPTRTWDGIIRDNLTSHFLAARTFLPRLAGRVDPVYVMLAGIAAELPVSTSGPISVTGAAQRMLIRTLAVEPIASQVRLHEVAILTPIVTRHWHGTPPEPDWLSGAEVGEYVADVLEPDFPEREKLLLRIPDAIALRIE